jgi:outer membrane receptor protein involved in Fe transport
MLAALEALAADDMGDISAFVPGLSVSNTSPTQANYSIRGVSTSDFGVGTDPAVGVYVDGVYAARSGAGLLAFSDVARIEVLKGPQGTLFGRNSAAGAVSITTNKPSDEFEARLGVRAIAPVARFAVGEGEGALELRGRARRARTLGGAHGPRPHLLARPPHPRA